MDSLISKFIAENLTLAAGKRLMNKDVLDAWVAATGETAGRNKLYAAIHHLHGVYKGQGYFTNVHLTPKEVKDVTVPVVAPVEMAAPVMQVPGLTAFEQMQLDLQRQALESKERARLVKMEAEAKLAAEKAEAKAAKAEAEAKLAREKMEAEKLKAEAEAKLAREKMEAEKLKAEAEAKLAREKMEADAKAIREKIEAEKLKAEAKAKLAREELDRKIARDVADAKAAAEANATKLRMVEMKISAAKDLMNMKLADSERSREFQRIENNKSRALYAVSSYNRHLDPEVVGTVSKQYVTGDSLRRCIEFNAWDWAGAHNLPAMKSLKNTITSMEEKIEVVLDGKSVEKSVVEIQAAIDLTSKVDTGVIPAKVVDASLKLVSEIPVEGTEEQPIVEESTAVAAEDIAGSQSMLLKRLVEVPKIASRDEDRHMKTELDWVVAEQKPKKDTAKRLDKRRYIRSKQSASFGGNGQIFVKCDCCGVMMNMDDDGCARGHNLPKARGGSWDVDNIRLICATCNNNMSDDYTIREYKIKVLYIPVTHESTGDASNEAESSDSESTGDASSDAESDASSEAH